MSCVLPDEFMSNMHEPIGIGYCLKSDTDLHNATGRSKPGPKKVTRKLCYRKDDRIMRPIHGALKIFGTH